MKAERSLISWFVVLFSFSGFVFVAINVWLRHPTQGKNVTVITDFFLLSVSAFALILSFAAQRLVTYRAAQATRILFFLLSVRFISGTETIIIVLLAAILVEFCVFESYPNNMVITTTLTTMVLLIRIILLVKAEIRLKDILVAQAPTALMGYLVSTLGSPMIYFREMVIDLQHDKNRMENFVVYLTRSNLEYQDYAISAREAGSEEERKRITRDIHDIVGYTLTNNMMLMESAIDMMQENPLGVPKIIEIARSNAEEGLNRIRQALYNLRKQDTQFPIGIRAIYRLASVFENATGIKVRCEFGNVSLINSEEIDSAVYHLVQESLINSFRHGKAGDITVTLWLNKGIVQVQVRDNGVGADLLPGRIVEGIGLQGMRERVERIGGTLSASAGPDGFIIEALIPASGKKDGTKNSVDHC